MLYDIFSLLRSDQCMHVASQSIFHAWFRVNGQLTDRPQGGKATKIDLPIQEREHATHHSQIRAAITPTLFEACPRAEKPYRTSTHSAYKALTPPRYPGQKKISFPEKKISRCMRSQPSLTLLFKTKECDCILSYRDHLFPTLLLAINYRACVKHSERFK
ncbi:hypothetical protein V6N13_057142 [Hibiscus sabdariffa]